MPALMISQVRVTDQDKFQDYLSKTREVAGTFGAEMLFFGQVADTLNGAPPEHQIVAVARFPDIDALRSWYGSDAYRALIPLREAGSDQHMVSYVTEAA